MTNIVDRLTGARIAALVGRLEGEKIWITEPRPANDIEVQAANAIRALATEALESRAEIERLRMACRGAGRLLDNIDPKEAGTAGETIQTALAILDGALSEGDRS